MTRLIPKLSLHALLLIGIVITIFPFVWVALMGTHSRSEIYSSPPPFFYGDDLQENYNKLLDIMPYWKVLINSLFVSVMGSLASIFFCSMCAYGFYAYEFKGKNIVFAVMISTLMIPPTLLIIPSFLTIKFYGLLDTHFALWFPAAANAFGIFLIRQYMANTITRNILDAAKLDGASDFRIYWSVVMPLIKPALATLGIVMFIGLWNNFLAPLILISSPEKYVLTLALRSLQSIANSPWGAIMLGTFLSMLPLLIAFVFFSKKIMDGLTTGVVKDLNRVVTTRPPKFR